ncbi:MAG: hypothetical protein WC748_08990 [Legionellales bacterium]|jgi:hypothetical protein
MIRVGDEGRKNVGLVDSMQNHAGLRLVGYLFFVIFLAQALWIYPAYQKFEQQELNRLGYTGLAIVETLLTLNSANITSEELKSLGDTLSLNTPLKGARVYDFNGTLITEFGELPMHEAAELQKPIEEGNRIEMAWAPQNAFTDYLIIARLDNSYVKTAVNNFLSFLLKMVFSVTFVSTLLLMWLLRNPGFRPWLQKITGIDQLKASRKVR